MAKVIEFYVLDFWPTKSNYIARKERGELIEFRAPKRNQANSNSAQWPGMCMVYMAPFAANCASGLRHYVSDTGKKLGDPDEELL
jgi:hypothetical protein